jgi:hypothetical protein
MDIRLDTEGDLRDQLVDRILVMSMVATILAIAGAQFRALDIGWGQRDLFQITVAALIGALFLTRHRFKAHPKTICLIVLLTLGGMPGVYSLGMLAGTIFLFPAVSVIVAIIYPLWATIVYIAISLLFCIWTAFRYCTQELGLGTGINLMERNPYHWAAYLLCMGMFFGVSAITISRYRRDMKTLLGRIGEQRERLERKNQALNEALKDVKKLSGLLPICTHCKKIRDDKGYWNQLEAYIEDHSDMAFSHGICQECARKYYPDIDPYED